MSTSDLGVQSIFRHIKDSIESHHTVVMVEFAIVGVIVQVTGLIIKRVVKTLKPTQIEAVVIKGKVYEAKAGSKIGALFLLVKLGH